MFIQHVFLVFSCCDQTTVRMCLSPPIKNTGISYQVSIFVMIFHSVLFPGIFIISIIWTPAIVLIVITTGFVEMPWKCSMASWLASPLFLPTSCCRNLPNVRYIASPHNHTHIHTCSRLRPSFGNPQDHVAACFYSKRVHVSSKLLILAGYLVDCEVVWILN